MALIQNFGCRVAAAALAIAAVGLAATPASAELRLSTPRPEVQRLLSVDEQAAGKSQAALVDAVEHFSAEQNVYGWLQSLFNGLGFEFNFLYSLVKASHARMHSIREHKLQAVLTALLVAPLLALSGVLTLVEVALRRGGTIETYSTLEEP